MSTNINITVGDNALLDAAKQQQSANRQAQLNREASTRLEAEATAARTTALAAQGRDANGNLITGAPFTQSQIERRPAANRINADEIILTPKSIFPGTVIIPSLVYPEGKSQVNNPEAVFYRESFGKFFPVISSTTGVGVLPSYPYFISDVSPVAGGKSVRVAPGYGFVSDLFGFPIFSIETLGRNGGISLRPSKPYTAEAWVYLPAPSGAEACTFALQLLFKTSLFTPIPIGGISVGVSVSNKVINAQLASFIDTPPRPVPEFVTLSGELLNVNDWNHLAFCVKDNVISWYINGRFLLDMSAEDNTAFDDFSAAFAAYDNVVIRASAGISANYGNSLWFRGVRFSPKVRYPTVPFTPVHY